MCHLGSFAMDEFAVGKLAERLISGYTTYVAALVLVKHPAAATVVETIKAENASSASLPIGYIHRKDGGYEAYHLTHF